MHRVLFAMYRKEGMSAEDFQAVLSSPEFAEAMEDSAKFVARASSYVVDQIPVVASGGAVR